jgi:fatty acid-binding protein DegV
MEVTQTLSIVTDSSVDLPADEVRRIGVEVAPIQVAFSTEFFRDDALARSEFYRRLPHTEERTSAARTCCA